ncbi:DnaJ family molecular chaperone [Mesorhizobium sp. WSM3879]|uniref:J domain-containing protein n=1 Tax=Mesorhizobium sp. WSM3879 TaxID=2029406 RepID=UPI0015CDFF33|nr:DnaJ family molecular chaperone [Mesorhizobium sp. WSM3879]
MARRKQSGVDDLIGWGVTLLVISVIAIVFALIAIIFLITWLFYLYPLIVLGSYLYIRHRRQSYPEIPSASEYDSEAVADQVKALVGTRSKFVNHIQKFYALGEEGGIHLTKGSNETRFDTRSSLGRELNDKIEAAEEMVTKLSNVIEDQISDVTTKFPFDGWSMKFYEWKRWESAKVALFESVRYLFLISVIAYGCSLFFQEWFLSFQNILAWKPFPDILLSPLLIGVIGSAISFPLLLRYHQKKLLDRVDADALAQWHALSRKWTASHFESLFQDAEEDFADRSKSIDEEAGNDWHLILKVEPSASPDEIKIAYRNAVKDYHPDRVSGLGSKLQELAERETKRLNAAYQAARTQKGF